MSTTPTPQPNAAVNTFITNADSQINTYLPSIVSGLANVQAAIAGSAGQSHLTTGLNIAQGVLAAAANVPNPTVQEVAGFGLLIESIFAGVASLFQHNTVTMTPSAPASSVVASPAPAVAVSLPPSGPAPVAASAATVPAAEPPTAPVANAVTPNANPSLAEKLFHPNIAKQEEAAAAALKAIPIPTK